MPSWKAERSAQSKPQIEITPALIRRVADYIQKHIFDPEGWYERRGIAEDEAQKLLRYLKRNTKQ